MKACKSATASSPSCVRKWRGLAYRFEKWRGKGGHAMVWVGDKVTTLPAREIDPKTASKIKKALGLE